MITFPAATVISPLPPGAPTQGYDAQMNPATAVGVNAQNQLVDANGALVLDTSGRPITAYGVGSSSGGSTGNAGGTGNTGVTPSSRSGFPWGPALVLAAIVGIGVAMSSNPRKRR